jgi:hypothetical protein
MSEPARICGDKEVALLFNLASQKIDLIARQLFDLQAAVSSLNQMMERSGADECQECGVARTPEWERVRNLLYPQNTPATGVK